MPTVEVLRIPVNKAYTDVQFDKLRTGAQKAGIVNQSYGREVEDPTQLYWVLRAFFVPVSLGEGSDASSCR
jgi:hypothetical protein